MADIPLRVSPRQIEVGAESKLVAETDDLSLVGYTVDLTVSPPGVISLNATSGILEYNAFGKVACSFVMTALAEGSVSISAVAHA